MRTTYPANSPQSYSKIERAAIAAKRTMGLDPEDYVSGERLFEAIEDYPELAGGIRIATSVEHLNPGILAESRYEYSMDGGELILALSPSTYADLEQEKPRARFSVFHEFGHLRLHYQELVHLSMIPRASQPALHRGAAKRVPSYLDVEWQANAFAGAFAVPATVMESLASEGFLRPEIVAKECGVSMDCAEIRIKIFRQKRRELLGL